MSVSDLIGDVDGLRFTNSEEVVGVVGGIEGPGAISIDGETRDVGYCISTINGSGVK